MSEDSSAQIRLEGVRLSFPALFTPTQGKNDDGTPQKPAYSAHFIMEKGSPAYSTTVKVMQMVANDEWGENGPTVLKTLIEQGRVCLRNGDSKTTADGEPMDGYAGNYFMSARGYVKPTIVDVDRSPLSESSGKPYSGCFVNAVVRIWAQKGQYGKRVNAQLMGVQFARDGEAFAGGAPADPMAFDNLAEFADDGDLMGDDDIAF